jgi:hypothetical protein
MTQGVRYAVDLVMCIDGTGSMSPLIEAVKSSALQFYEKLETVMASKDKKIDQLRARIIVFRDFWADAPDMALQSSDFFNLRTQAAEFANFVARITADGGGDEPENGLEAVALALRSPWEKSQNFAKQRHVVVVYTDASAHSLEKAPKPSHYPQGIPPTFDALTDDWAEMPVSAKRLLLFAPDATPWTVMASSWENTIQFASRAGDGLQEIEMEEILNSIASSI